MKKYIIIVICIALLGVLLIFLPCYFRQKQNDNLIQSNIDKSNKHNEKMDSISSTTDSLITLENENIKSEIYDEEQIFFENIEIIYNYFSFNQVDNLRVDMQNYIHNYVNKNILDCKIIIESINENDNKFTFEFEVDTKIYTCSITSDSESDNIEISFVESLN